MIDVTVVSTTNVSLIIKYT